MVEELPRNPAHPKVETIDETELELVCEGPPAKKKAPMVVDLTLSSDSEEDEDTLLSIKERMLNRQRSSGSQSSCPPDSADENTTPSTGILNYIIFYHLFADEFVFIAPVNLSSNAEAEVVGVAMNLHKTKDVRRMSGGCQRSRVLLLRAHLT